MKIHKDFWKNDWGFVWLLVIMLATVIVTQFRGVIWEEMFLVRFSFFIFMLIAIRSSALSSHSKKIGYAVSLTLLLFGLVLVKDDSKPLLLIHSGLITTFMIFTLILVIKQIFEPGKMTLQKIGGGVAVYIIIGHLFSILYVISFQLDPESFQFANGKILPEEALRQLSYFSFVTLTTIGYGDITAVGSFARVLVIMEGLLGQLFPAIFIAKLVSLQIEDTKQKG